MHRAPRGMGQRAGGGHDAAGFDQAEWEAIDRRTGDAVSTSTGRRAGQGELRAAGPKRGMRAHRSVEMAKASQRTLGDELRRACCACHGLLRGVVFNRDRVLDFGTVGGGLIDRGRGLALCLLYRCRRTVRIKARVIDRSKTFVMI